MTVTHRISLMVLAVDKRQKYTINQNFRTNLLQKKMSWNEYKRLSTSSGTSYFWPGKENTFFSLVLVIVFVFVTVFDELDVAFAFTFTWALHIERIIRKSNSPKANKKATGITSISMLLIWKCWHASFSSRRYSCDKIVIKSTD